MPIVDLGCNHMIRTIEFADNIRWVARLRMPPVSHESTPDDVAVRIEVNQNRPGEDKYPYTADPYIRYKCVLRCWSTLYVDGLSTGQRGHEP